MGDAVDALETRRVTKVMQKFKHFQTQAYEVGQKQNIGGYFL